MEKQTNQQQQVNANLNEMARKDVLGLNEIMSNVMSELNEKMKEGIAKINEKVVGIGMEGKNAKLTLEEKQVLKRKMEEMEVYIKELKSLIRGRGMPSELLNELFGSLPLEKTFCLLAKMPNGLLARNVQKMINGIKEALKNNKLNEEDCGPSLEISEDGLVIRQNGPYEKNSVRAILSIPIFTLNLKHTKPTIAFYFEMQILHKPNHYSPISIGFCGQHFKLERETLGWEKNSIGINSKDGMHVDGSWTDFENVDENFFEGNVIGPGIIHHPNSIIECFATFNGKLLGKAILPLKFLNFLQSQQLFPAVTLANAGDSIRLNFGKEEWQFKEFGRILK